MRILLDTHVFLWDISAAPVWEAVIKRALG